MGRRRQPPDTLKIPERTNYVPVAVAESTNAEVVAVREAAAYAAKLLRSSEALSKLWGTLVALRQAYVVAYGGIQEELSKVREQEEEAPVLLEDILIQAAMRSAGQAFSEHDLMKSIANVVLPCLADIIDQHSATDEESHREAVREAEERRRSAPVPIGFKHSQELEEPVLGRDRSLVFVGPSGAVAWLLEHICQHVLNETENLVIRFQESASRLESHARLLRIGDNMWRGCCDSPRHLAKTMGESGAATLNSLPDLLICDNLVTAFTKSYTGRPGAATAGDAHRQFQKWCKGVGCAFVGGLSMDEEELDLKHPSFEQLRAFTTLRPVRVRDGSTPELCEIVIGNEDAHFEVDRAVLAKCGRGTVLIP